MPTPRSQIVDFDAPGLYHCISRCVRRAFLCDGAGTDRKAWIHDRMILLSNVFAIDVGGFSILDNHFHSVLAIHPERVPGWSDLDIARRWYRVFPLSIQRWAVEVAERDPVLRKKINVLGLLPPELAIRLVAGLGERIAILRKRLSSISWFMRCLKHHIAVLANREDECTGHFWEGRFKSIRILDVAALLKTLLYVDLNVIRAGLAPTPESSPHTSVQDRIHVHQHYEKKRGRRRTAPPRARWLLRPGRHRSPDQGGWLAPIRHLLEITVEQYLSTVDLVGRTARTGTQCTIPRDLAPILERLELTAEDLTEVAAAQRGSMPRGTVAGSPASCAAEAARRGARYVLSAFRLG